MTPEEQAHFRVLKLLEDNPHCNQRELAQALGMSLGKTNYVLRALMAKGFLKAARLLQSNQPLSKTAYVLTPAGLGHRLALTQAYIQRKKQEYEALKAELEGLQNEIQ